MKQNNNLNYYQKFKEATQGMSPEQIIELFENEYAFKLGTPGTYLTDLHQEENFDFTEEDFLLIKPEEELLLTKLEED